jgi:acyl-coenzyme A thioesterase 13
MSEKLSPIYRLLRILTSTVGKTLAYTSVKFINKDNEIVARGSHTKYVAIAQNDPQNIVDQLKPEMPESKVD